MREVVGRALGSYRRERSRDLQDLAKICNTDQVVMTLTTRRALAALILALWFAPSAGAIGIGLHLAFGHHHHTPEVEHGHHHGSHEPDAHADDVARLADTLGHGHRHDGEVAPDHEHPATFAKTAPTVPTAQIHNVLPTSLTLEPNDAGTPCVPLSHRGPPTPLFTSNCSLLL